MLGGALSFWKGLLKN